MDRKLNETSRIVRIVGLALAIFSLAAVATQSVAETSKQPKGRTIALRLIGTATMASLPWDKWPKALQDKLPNGAECYRAPLFDVSGSIRRGTGISCLSDRIDSGEAITVLNTVFFKVPGGLIISQGRMTAQPVVTPRSLGGVYGGMSHLVGALPNERNVVYTTKGFKRWTGRVRSSGFADLTQYDDGKIRVDIVYGIRLRKK